MSSELRQIELIDQLTKVISSMQDEIKNSRNRISLLEDNLNTQYILINRLEHRIATLESDSDL
jgi:hypothetical protein